MDSFSSESSHQMFFLTLIFVKCNIHQPSTIIRRQYKNNLTMPVRETTLDWKNAMLTAITANKTIRKSPCDIIVPLSLPPSFSYLFILSLWSIDDDGRRSISRRQLHRITDILELLFAVLFLWLGNTIF